MSFEFMAVTQDDLDLDLYVAMTALAEYTRKTGNDVTLVIDRRPARG